MIRLVRLLYCLVGFLLAFLLGSPIQAQIATPDDAPEPLSPQESAKLFNVPPGFRVELVAAEPLVREPSGVCWDASGQLYVSELHGYNLEGQLDIEALNQTGELDRVVRRIQASERYKKAAEAETYGTIKRLHDTDGDGRMDTADVWADRIPPCLGICPARDGLIAACQTKIVFLADRDEDGVAEIREVLFEGFAKGPLERSVNSPQWGPDNWIYLGNGAGGGLIEGKYLKKPVQLPRTDFRIRADGSAIEPVVGSTGTIGFAMTETGDRFVVSTGAPGIFVAPIAWRYLERHAEVATPRLERQATSDQRAWPTSKPHPWRTRRAADPGFAKFYTDRYGVEETQPNGYFTSACSPLVYRDNALPGLEGQLLACEPAQNLIHRAIVRRDGVALTLHRPEREQRAEFFTSRDPWFHAISLAHAPDGRILIVDFYREIIEDYSAIPRYLQQQYGLDGGRSYGRLWCLTHENLKSITNHSGPAPVEQTNRQLVTELASPRFWRRQTARRLLLERQATQMAGPISNYIHDGDQHDVATLLNALHTLDDLGRLTERDVQTALQHSAWSVRRLAVRLAERWLNPNQTATHRRRLDPISGPTTILSHLLARIDDPQPAVRLQLALTLGESRDPRALDALIQLARSDGDQLWMPLAILTSVGDRSQTLLTRLLSEPQQLGKSRPLLEPLCAAIANQQDRDQLATALLAIARLDRAPRIQSICLQGIRSALTQAIDLDLSAETRQAIMELGDSADHEVSRQAWSLIRLLKLETPRQRARRIERALAQVGDVQATVTTRLRAVSQLASELDEDTTRGLLRKVSKTTPRVQQAILDTVVAHQKRLPVLLRAMESNQFPASLLTALQRAALKNSQNPAIRKRAEALFKESPSVPDRVIAEYMEALNKERNVQHGAAVFRKHCATCHQAHGVGVAVGPNLDSEFMRVEETIVRDVLAPSDKLTAGYVAYTVTTHNGEVTTGLLTEESPTSVTLRQAEGKQRVILRKDIDQLQAMPVSLMPDNLREAVSPKDLADLLAWLRRPPESVVLLDENRDFVSHLNEGEGVAEFISDDSIHGRFSLRVTAPQRYASRIAGWRFPIRERPGPGEYRFIRYAWKSQGADGVMLEFADDGRWPPADQPVRRYHAGRNTTGWRSVEVAKSPPAQWNVVTRDLWQEFGDFTLTGIAPTAMNGAVLLDRVELLQSP